MSDAFDSQALSGDGQNNNLTGILSRLTDPTAPTEVVGWDAFNAAFAEQIDGLGAMTRRDVRMIAGVSTYRSRPRRPGIR